MGLGKFDEDSLLEFREKALLHYSQPDLSDDYNLGNWARNAVNAVTSAASDLVNRVTGRGNAPPPDRDPPLNQRSGTRTDRDPPLNRRVPATPSPSPSSPRPSSSGSGSGSGRASTPRPQPRGESAAEREARLRREREEAERRERERREAEERIRQQRIAAENARKERLQAITRDVANRVIENALDREASNRPDSDSQLCQRPDGSIYGIAPGRRCVTGEPIAQRPENDPTQQINEAARNNPDQQMMPANQRTVGGTSPANSADARVSGQQTETLSDDQSNMA